MDFTKIKCMSNVCKDPEDWDLNWDSISKKNRREIVNRINDHNESLKILAIGLKASIEGLQEENRRLKEELTKLQTSKPAK